MEIRWSALPMNLYVQLRLFGYVPGYVGDMTTPLSTVSLLNSYTHPSSDLRPWSYGSRKKKWFKCFPSSTQSTTPITKRVTLTGVDELECAREAAASFDTVCVIGKHNRVVIAHQRVWLFPAAPTRKKARLYIIVQCGLVHFYVDVNVFVHTAFIKQ